MTENQNTSGSKGDGPSGPASRGHDDTNGPGMTNGVPDNAEDAEATAAPESQRERSETAGGSSTPTEPGHG